MWCEHNRCTIATEACIKRRIAAKEKKYPSDIEDNFKKCLRCTTGILVARFKENFINKDIFNLKKKQINEILKRGYVFKSDSILEEESNPSFIKLKEKRKREIGINNFRNNKREIEGYINLKRNFA